MAEIIQHPVVKFFLCILKNAGFAITIAIGLAVLTIPPSDKPSMLVLLICGGFTGILGVIFLNPIKKWKLFVGIIIFLLVWVPFAIHRFKKLDVQEQYMKEIIEEKLSGPRIKDGNFEAGDLLQYWESSERARIIKPISSDNEVRINPFVESKKYAMDTSYYGMDGSRSLRILNKAIQKSGKPIFIRQRINVKSNQQYKLRFFVYGKSENRESLRFAIGDNNWEGGVRIEPNEIDNDGWGPPIEKIIKTNSETRSNFYIINNHIADLFIDNVSLDECGGAVKC